ncbi:MAG: PaaI family thioesterase [Syntrophomonadaceae bacterium]|nr:PaaI family thioesterase [Syntrophomonadaceae bacterium]
MREVNIADIENRGIKNEFFNLLCERWMSFPIHKVLDISLVYLGQGTVGIRMQAGGEFTTIRERLHGGIGATLADTAMGWAIITLGRTCVTVDMYINYIAPIFAQDVIIAEGNIVHSGKRTVVAEATLLNQKGELVAKSRGTFSLKKGNLQELE